MSDLEKELNQIVPPRLHNPIFRQKLRRKLLNRHGRRKRSTWWPILTTGLAAVCLTLIWKPDLADSVHKWVWDYSAPNPQETIAQATPVKAEIDRWLSSEAEDKAILANWAQSEGNVKLMGQSAETEILAVRRFMLSDGRVMEIYTQVPVDKTHSEKPEAMKNENFIY